MVFSTQYGCMVVVQYSLLFVDIVINSFSLLSAVHSLVVVLVISVLQDVVILSLLMTLLLGFFNTFAFTVGLLRVIVWKFKWTLFIGVLYLIFTILFQSLLFSFHWNRNLVITYWAAPVQVLYTIHKLSALLFYFTYKKAIYRLSDIKLYSNSDWLKTQMTNLSI